MSLGLRRRSLSHLSSESPLAITALDGTVLDRAGNPTAIDPPAASAATSELSGGGKSLFCHPTVTIQTVCWVSPCN